MPRTRHPKPPTIPLNTIAPLDLHLLKHLVELLTADVYSEEICSYLDEVGRSKSSRLRDKTKQSLIGAAMDKVFLRSAILFCVDVEAWERQISRVTEIGVAIYDPRGQEMALSPFIKTYHILIEENKHLKNGQFVPHHANNFNGGVSYVLKKNDATLLMQRLVNEYFNHPMPCLLVGHDVRGDIKWLKQLGVRIPDQVEVLDTQTLYSQTHGKQGNSLKNALRDIGQPYAFLHNAGNDAYFTVLLAMRLCDPQVRRMTYFDEDADETSQGRQINNLLDHNTSKTVVATVEGVMNNAVTLS